MGAVRVLQGDCRTVLAEEGEPYDACVTDPPYHLESIVRRFGKADSAPAKIGATGAFARSSAGFMGEGWDGADEDGVRVAFEPETWRAIYDRLKPGAYLVAFGHSRNFHRIVCAIEDAGFEIRDTLYWIYGTGFPKSHDISKGIDKHLGIERETIGYRDVGPDITGNNYSRDDGARRQQPVTKPGSPEAEQWEGWGTALKPAFEPICLARKPCEFGVFENVLKHGVGGINIDACRIPVEDEDYARNCAGDRGHHDNRTRDMEAFKQTSGSAHDLGRFPANILWDGSPEIEAMFPDSNGADSTVGPHLGDRLAVNVYSDYGARPLMLPRGDTGSAARFFYSAKAGDLDRLGSAHATVKPVDLMRWLIRLITPPGGRILDPFAGSGTTGIAAIAEGFDCDLIELLPKHVADIERKLALLSGEGRHRLVELNERRSKAKKKRAMPLFGEEDAA